MGEWSLEAARRLDAEDPLARLRDRFYVPEGMAYLCGNSLGLQPRGVEEALAAELEDWRRLGVRGHFQAARPWYSYPETFREPMAAVVGARPGEVVLMNALTVNLHLMLASFYRPTAERFKILIDAPVFPSDGYAVESQIQLHGLDPERALVVVRPPDGTSLVRLEDVEAALAEHVDSIALVLLAGVNFRTGQALDVGRITAMAHAVGARVGWDMAHAAGNLRLRLHDDGPDFAVWCTYKYLNAGPGAVGGCFVHERHARSLDLPRLAGWWGNAPETRFEMPEHFVPQPGAAGWQVSNAPVLSMAAARVALEIFAEVGMEALRAKSVRLTGYLERLLDDVGGEAFAIVTPRDPERRGCQLSLAFAEGQRARRAAAALDAAGVVCDFRAPDVIRAAPVPLYNRFEDVWRMADVLRREVAGTG